MYTAALLKLLDFRVEFGWKTAAGRGLLPQVSQNPMHHADNVLDLIFYLYVIVVLIIFLLH